MTSHVSTSWLMILTAHRICVSVRDDKRPAVVPRGPDDQQGSDSYAASSANEHAGPAG
jgi:hypothetical protein